MAQFDFVAIGDPVIDNFIRLKDARVHCNLNDEDCEICMAWGAKIPFESSTEVPGVGNAPNAAVSAARLGLNAAMRAYVGADEHGDKCVKALKDSGVDTSLVEQVSGKVTNYHFVLWYEDNRTILVKHEEFEYKVPELSEPPKWVYLSSLADNSLPYHEAWLTKLTEWSETKLAFQPGTFQMKMGAKALKQIYQRSNIFFCNKEEAEQILGLPTGSDMRELLRQMQHLGPKIAVITDDARGGYAIDEDGSIYHTPRYPDTRPAFEITGAGDAFASTTAIALALGKPLSEAIQWGAVNASAVLQEIGAQKGLLTREQLEHNLANPPEPEKFKVEKL